jgi:tRNA(Ile)-lysidine synthase TilS/MesJ
MTMAYVTTSMINSRSWNSEDTLTDLLDRYRGKGGEYDCIAPISGGRDSTYVLHQMVTSYNMRVLALTVDSGFITEDAYRMLSIIFL